MPEATPPGAPPAGNALTALIVEDDPDLLDTLEAYFRAQGFRTERARNGRAALDVFQAARPGVVILDIGLPELDGLSVLQRLRSAGHRTPVILLTARVEEVDELLGLGFGADDYVTKPFSPRVLMARVQGVLRRAAPVTQAAELLQVGPLSLDTGAVLARVNGAALALTPAEFRLLEELARHPGRATTRAALLEGALPESDALERAVDVHMKNLRRKLEAAGAPELLHTVRYRLGNGGA